MSVLIKRYANRKLYNTETSRYITLKGIAELIEDGQEIRVVDNETGEDITSVALSQILVDNERTNRTVPGSVLTELIHRGGDVLYSALRRGMDDASEGITEFQRNVRKLVRTREGEAEEHPENAGNRGDGVSELEKIFQGSVERVFRLLDLPRRRDVEALNENLERVARALESIEDARPATVIEEDSDAAPPRRS